MDDVAEIARGLSGISKIVIYLEGIAYGRSPFSKSLMRPLERQNLFSRVEMRGFQPRWDLTPLGLAVRAHLTRKDEDDG